jgi:RNA-directed DNA polymerase
MWLAREHPGVTFERYCDDAVIHCTSQAQAVMIRDALAARLAEVWSAPASLEAAMVANRL